MAKFDVIVPQCPIYQIEAERFQVTSSGRFVHFIDHNRQVGTVAVAPGLLIRQSPERK